MGRFCDDKMQFSDHPIGTQVSAKWGTKGRIVSIRLHRQDIGIHAFTVTAEGTL